MSDTEFYYEFRRTDLPPLLRRVQKSIRNRKVNVAVTSLAIKREGTVWYARIDCAEVEE